MIGLALFDQQPKARVFIHERVCRKAFDKRKTGTADSAFEEVQKQLDLEKRPSPTINRYFLQPRGKTYVAPQLGRLRLTLKEISGT